MKHGAIWITWESQRRNRELSAALGATLFEFAEIDRMGYRLAKYTRGAARTIAALLRTRPRLVFCQNPSLVLCLLLILLRPFFRFRLSVDAHNAGLFPHEGRSRVLMALSRCIQRRADLTIVSNEALGDEVRSNRGRPFVLPDRIPTIPAVDRRTLRGAHSILFICSYSKDEPYGEVFRAGRLLDAGICIYVTGDFARAGVRPDELPPNVVLTGFLAEAEYTAMLQSVDATIDLTTRENCLVCGAYETLAVAKPVILSDTRALRAYFSRGAVYVRNTAEDIARGISTAVASKSALEAEARALREQRIREWEERRISLLTTLDFTGAEDRSRA